MKTSRVFSVVVCCCLLAMVVLAEPASAETPPDMPGSSVWIPWNDFRPILEKLQAGTPAPPEPAPPFEAVVSRADHLAIVGGQGVSVTATADVLVLVKDAWTLVPVMRAGAPLSEAKLDGKTTALVDKDGWLHLLVRGQGSHTLTLGLQLDLTKNSGPDQFVLPTVKAQVCRLEVRMPDPDLRVYVDGGGHIESETHGKQTVAVGSFPPRENLTVSWTPSMPESTKEEARVAVEVRTMLTVGEGLGVYTAIIDYTIQHKPVSRFALALPAAVSVADVSTYGLVDWDVVKSGDTQRLTVSLSFGAIGRHQVAVTYEEVLPEGESVTFATADPIVEDVVHEVGFLAVAVRSNVQVDPTEGSLKNLARLDPSELPPDLRGSGDQRVLYGFKYLRHPAGLSLDVVKHEDASVLTCEVQHAGYRILLTDRGKQLIEATYRVANRSMQYLSITLPEGTDLWGVYRDGVPIKAAEENGRVLLPIFTGGPSGPFTMRVVAFRDTSVLRPVGSRAIELPVLDVGIRQMDLELYSPSEFRLFGFGGDLRLTGGRPSSAIVSNGDSSDVTFGWSYSDDSDLDFVTQNEADYKQNVRYRDEQSRMQRSIANIPVSASNENYLGTMARGALPVVLDIAWEGAHHTFGTQIVEPGETASVTFFYNRRGLSRATGVILLIAAIYLGFLAATYLIARLSDRPDPPARIHGPLGLSALFLAGVLIFGFDGAKGTLIFGFFLGVVAVLAMRLLAKKKPAPYAMPVPPPAPPAPPVSGGEGGAL